MKTFATFTLLVHSASKAPSPSSFFEIGWLRSKWVSSLACFLLLISCTGIIAPQDVFAGSFSAVMSRIHATDKITLMVNVKTFGYFTMNNLPQYSISKGIILFGIEPKSWPATWITSSEPFPMLIGACFFNFGPQSNNVIVGQNVFHVRILSDWLQPCDGKKAEAGRKTGHRERLSERTPTGDAIVRSHGKQNHERAAEMTALCSSNGYITKNILMQEHITPCYGAIQEQVSTLPAVMNLFGDGSKFGKPINNVGVRGYVFLARVAPNWAMGFRPEGTTGVGAAGNQNFTNATVTLRYFYVPITITGQAENLSKGESRAFMQAKALEAKFDMKDAVSHVNVLVIGAEPGGQLAQAKAPIVANTSFTADNTGLLPGAIYLRVGQFIDSIPVGGGAPDFLGLKITAINYSTNVVTVAGTSVAGHAIALGNPGGGQGEYPQVAIVNDGWFACNGFQNLVNSSGVVEGVDPGVFPSWQSFLFDNGNAALSSQVLQMLRQFTKNRGGVDGNIFIVPSAQINQYVGIATTTLRFDITNEGPAAKVGKKALDLGFNVFDYAGLPMVEDKDARTDRIFHGDTEMMKKFEAIPLSLAEDEAGTWTRIIGANGIADAVAGLLRWYVNIGIVQRSAWGRLQNLLVPASFATAPPTL